VRTARQHKTLPDRAGFGTSRWLASPADLSLPATRGTKISWRVRRRKTSRLETNGPRDSEEL
jgi:hypothetical protein